MSFIRIDNSSTFLPGGVLGQNAGQNAAQAQPQPASNTGLPLVETAGLLQATNTAINNPNFAQQWGDKIEVLGGQEMALEALHNAQKRQNKITGHNNPASPDTSKTSHGASYSQIFNLGEQQTKLHQLSWQNLSNTVRENVQNFRNKLQTKGITGLLSETSPKTYIKEKLWHNNIKPVQNLINGESGISRATGLIGTVALGALGADVLKNTKQAYQQAKQQEADGIKGKLHTYRETGTAFAKYLGRDAGTWEAASLGATIGKAVLPIAIGGVSLGGVGLGALAAVAAKQGLDKMLHTGTQTPAAKAAKTTP